MHKKWLVGGMALSTAGLVLASGGQIASADRGGAKAVKAIVVRSWSGCGSGEVVWRSLNDDWPLYGDVPIRIRYRFSLCRDGAEVTLEALERSGADVVILSDVAGGDQEFSTDEVEALRTYLQEGHDLLGTFFVFKWPGHIVDNGALAELFGLTPQPNWGASDLGSDVTYRLRVNQHHGPAARLFRSLGDTFTSEGYPQTQLPEDGVWSRNDMAGAKIIAASADRSAAIVVCPCGAYTAIYIANMPEYSGGAADLQFLYNAITYKQRS